MAEDILSIYRRWLKFSPIDEDLVARQKEAVLGIAQAGKTGETALEIAKSAVVLADQLVYLFESAQSLPKPIVCRAGCYFCCFTQVELTPPEALLLGHYVEDHFSPEEKQGLRERVAKNLKLKAGKNKMEIASMRQELPCPLLREGRCSVYPARPLLCRAMHSLAAEQCELELRSHELFSFEFYSHRYEFILSVSAGLMAGCQAIGCQSKVLDLAGAIQAFFTSARPAVAWMQGENVFG
jgi:Fe-S-cluster containining protein